MIYNSEVSLVVLVPSNYYRNQIPILQRQFSENIQAISENLKLRKLDTLVQFNFFQNHEELINDPRKKLDSNYANKK